MILWLSGAYGVGKSTVAEALAKRLGRAFVFDAEAVGNAVRDNDPDWTFGPVFEDYPLWIAFCEQLLLDLHARSGRDILVPMTLMRPASYGLIERLRQNGVDTRLVILEAAPGTIRDRILARGEDETCWCMQNMEAAISGAVSLPGLRLNTDDRTPDELADTLWAMMTR